jgi:hypothetical protein
LEDYQSILDNSGSTLDQIPAAVLGLLGEPLYGASCAPEVSYTAIGGVDECGFGRIDVTWLITSASGTTNACLQRAYIEQFDENRLQCDDIVFPAGSPEAIAFGPYPFCEVNDNENDPDDDQPSVDITDCGGAIVTEPTLDNNQLCTAIGINMTADTFDFADGACKKIVVHWEVIDQCVYEENWVNPETGEIDPFHSDNGYFEFYGEYNIFDSEAPVVNCTTEILADCTQDFLGPITTDATDNCSDPSVFGWTWAFDLHNDGTIDSEGAGGEIYANAAGLTFFPLGEHRVIWNVNDGCGNVSNGNECIINIVPDDNKAPTPYCYDGIATAVMEPSATVTIWAVDFDAGSFDDCDEDLTYTIIPESHAIGLGDDLAHEQSTSGWTFDCSYLIDGQTNEFEVRVYVTDDGGNYDFCRARLRIDDNLDVCPDDGTVTANISGRIVNEYGSNIESADVTLESTHPEFPRYTISDDDGEFEFNSNPMYNDYGLSSSRDYDYLNGVSTLDLVLIQKYILGQLSFDSAYKVIASDINGDEKVSAIDLLQLRKLILGLYANNDLPQNESWRFVDSNQEFADINSPWPIDESKSILNLIAEMENQNLIGVKIGDVNGSAQVSGLLSAQIRTSGTTTFEVLDKELSKSDIVRLDFTSNDFEEVFGFQFTMDFAKEDLKYVGIEPGVLGLNEANFGLNRTEEGSITASWNSNDGVSVDKNEVLFSLIFTAKSSGSKISESVAISSRITSAEAYTGSGLHETDLELLFRTDITNVEVAGYELYQNEPNPFIGETVIGFNLPEAGNATITIYDVTGKVIEVLSDNYAIGYNSVSINRNTISTSGVLYYKLESGDFIATKKMIILE